MFSLDRRLDKAIYLTSRSRAVLRSWRYLGSFLQFSQEEMNEIDNTESNEIQKCERLLRLWRGRGEPHQGPQALTAILRRAGFFYIAGTFTFYSYFLKTHVKSVKNSKFVTIFNIHVLIVKDLNSCNNFWTKGHNFWLDSKLIFKYVNVQYRSDLT